VGLCQAGYQVVGADHKPQPHYPFSSLFRLEDALETRFDCIDLIWASPPCQRFTAYRRRPDHVYESPNLIPAIRERLQAWGGPYIIENIAGAPLENPQRLCGSSFGLDVRRHRYFETNFNWESPLCDHAWQTPRFQPATNRTNLRSTVEVGVWRIPLEVQQRAMGIAWMTREELSQAIPPVYAQCIASQV